MNIVIAGLGKFGKELIENLSKEGHNVTIIDNKANVVEDTVNRYDVMGIVGNAASYDIQKDANVAKADLFVATTFILVSFYSIYIYSSKLFFRCSYMFIIPWK